MASYEVIHGRTGYRDIDKVFKTYDAAERYRKKQKGLGRDDVHYLEIDRVDASGSKKKKNKLKIRKAQGTNIPRQIYKHLTGDPERAFFMKNDKKGN